MCKNCQCLRCEMDDAKLAALEAKLELVRGLVEKWQRMADDYRWAPDIRGAREASARDLIDALADSAPPAEGEEPTAKATLPATRTAK